MEEINSLISTGSAELSFEVSDSQDALISDYLNEVDSAWCLRSLALIAANKLAGNPEDAVQKLYESTGGRHDNPIARCFKTDCHVLASITSLSLITPPNCAVYVPNKSSIEA